MFVVLQVLFVMNPNIQPVASKIHEMILCHPLALNNLAPALMNFYTGIVLLLCFLFPFYKAISILVYFEAVFLTIASIHFSHLDL